MRALTSRRHDDDHVPTDRGYRRSRNWAALGLVGVVVAVLLFFGVRALMGLGGPNYGSYVDDDVRPLVDESNKLGEALSQLLARPEEDDRAALIEQLAEWAETASSLVAKAEAIESSGQLDAVTAELAAVLSARAAAFDTYDTSISGAIERGGDAETSVLLEAIVDANRDFLAADRFYLMFQERLSEILREEGVTDVEVPSSIYFPNPAAGEEPASAEFVEALTGSPAVAHTRNVTLVDISLKPTPTDIDGDVQTVIADEAFEVLVTVKNNGERTEEQIALKVTLREEGPGGDEVQQQVVDVTDLEAGASRTSSVRGLRPVEGLNRITVSVGPVPRETDDQDNIRTIDIDYVP